MALSPAVEPFNGATPVRRSRAWVSGLTNVFKLRGRSPRTRVWVLGVVVSAGALAMVSASAGPVRPPKILRVDVDRVLVPAGPAILGSNDGALDERPRRTEQVPAFRIDRHEVPRGHYAVCVAAGRCTPAGDIKVDVDPTAVPQADHPMTDVDWQQARAFCRFARGRLPREAEWEKAARGTDGREYPWGDALACEKANWGNFSGEGPCAHTAPGRPIPGGAYPQHGSPYGVEDMAGNVWEWVEDQYPGHPDRRMVKGGSCCSYFVQPRAANRNGWAPEYHDGDLGFRCVSQ